MKKKTAFWVGVVTLVLLFALTAAAAPEALPGIGQTIVAAIAACTIGYQGANVADNAVKGRFYRPELAQGGAAGASGAPSAPSASPKTGGAP